MESIRCKNEIELWVPYPHFPNTYEVSSFGRVRNKHTGKLQKINYQDPYPRVSICGVPIRLHRVICNTFIVECPDGYEVNHKDLNKRNNHVSNLEYVTHYENMQTSSRDRNSYLWGGATLTESENTLKCLRCGHVWYPKPGTTPKVCPRCKSYKWNVQKKEKTP